MEIIVILIIQPVEHGHILQQLGLIAFQRTGDIVHIGGNLAVAGLHPLHFILRLGEQPGQAFGFLRVLLEALQLRHEIHQHVADFPGILRFDRIQRGLGEIGDFFLRVGTEEQHMIRIGHIHLRNEIINRLFLRVCQLAFIQAGGGNRFFRGLFRRLLDAGYRFRRGFRYGSGGRKGKLGHHAGF